MIEKETTDFQNVARTGLASIDKPWLQYYAEEYRRFQPTRTTLRHFLGSRNIDHDKAVLEYYGCTYSLNDIFMQADRVAKALVALGVQEGDRIPVFMRSVPEFVFLLLAAETIGVSLVCRDGTREELLEAIQNAEASYLFVYEYLSKADEEYFYSNSNVRGMVLLSPYTYADRTQMPDYIQENIESLYRCETASDPRGIAWNDFLAAGDRFDGPFEAVENPNRPLYHSYTSGATGPSKEIIHTASTMAGFISQLVVVSTSGENHFAVRCLLTLLPPALVAVVNPMILYNIASTNLLILSTFSELEDIDLEFMRYKPNQMIAIPMMADFLMNSKRIPEDFPMDYLYLIGGGADPMHNKWLGKMQSFLKKHGSNAMFSMCYGLSEAGSGVANPHSKSCFLDCGGGIPMRGTIVSIFKKDTHEELSYGEIGEICTNGPGSMVGYSSPEETAKTLQLHADGNIWVHTNDYGYMNENGELFVLSRGLNERFGGGYLFATVMENRVVEISGIDDCFVVVVPDKEHEGYMLPYLYIVLEDGFVLADVEAKIKAALEAHEQPVSITVVKEREYFHFKTNRRLIAEKIMQE